MKTVFSILDYLPITEENLEGKIVILKESSLDDSFKEAKYQLVKANSGFGCDPHSLGRAVFVTWLVDGDTGQMNREDILGIATEDAIAEWKSLYGEFKEEK